MFEIFQKYILEKVLLTDNEFERMKSLSIEKKIRKKQYLLQEGDIWKYNAFMCKGFTRMYRIGEDGMEHILRFSVETWWVGDRESYMAEQPSKNNIDAIEDSEILMWKKADFEMLQKEIPALNTFEQQLLSRSLNANQNRIYAAISYTAEEKYHDFIKAQPGIFNRVPLHMIASYLGVSRETLSRIRSQFAQK